MTCLPWWLNLSLVSGLALRFMSLAKTELWYDEAFTRLMLRLPFTRMIQATAGDTHPPGYYAILWVWSRLFGEGEISLRLPSVILSLVCLWLVWAVADRLRMSKTAKYLLLAYMAISPAQIYFAQEARMYSMLQALVLAGVLCVLERRWLWLGVVNAGLLWVHNYGLFYVPVLAGLAVYRERDIEPVLLPVLLPVISWLPWLIVLLKQMHTVSTGYWITQVTWGQIVYTLNIFIFGAFTRQFSLLTVLVTVGLLSWAIVRNAHNNSAWLYQVLWLAFAPMLCAVLASFIWKPVYLFRGLLGSAPFIYILAIAPLAELQHKWQRLYMAGLIAPAMIAGLLGYWIDISQFKSTTTDTLNKVRAEYQPGDIVYSTNDGTWVTWSAYDNTMPIYLMPECAEHDRGSLSPVTREAMGVRIAELSELEYNRAWILYNVGATTSQCNANKANQIIAELVEPWHIVMDSETVTSGVWLIETLEGSKAQ